MKAYFTDDIAPGRQTADKVVIDESKVPFPDWFEEWKELREKADHKKADELLDKVINRKTSSP